MSPPGMERVRPWRLVTLVPLVLHLGCGPSLQRPEKFTPHRVKDMLFKDECRLQEYFDHEPSMSPCEARAVSSPRSGAEVGRLTFAVSPGISLDALSRLLRAYYQRVPPLRPTDRIRATVPYVQHGHRGVAARHLPIGADTTLEINGRQLSLPYHPCLGALFLGADHYAMRRKALGLPGAAVDRQASEHLRALAGDDPERSQAAAAALAKLGAPAVAELARALSRQPPVPLRRRLVTVLRSIGPPALAAFPVLLEQLDQADLPLQRVAALTLLELSPSLRPSVSSPDPNARARGAEALARLDLRPPMLVLLKTLCGENSTARDEIWTALRQQPQVSIPALLRALKDSSSAIRALAAEGLGSMAERRAALAPPELDSIRSALAAASEDGDKNVRRAARKAARLLQPAKQGASRSD